MTIQEIERNIAYRQELLEELHQLNNFFSDLMLNKAHLIDLQINYTVPEKQTKESIIDSDGSLISNNQQTGNLFFDFIDHIKQNSPAFKSKSSGAKSIKIPLSNSVIMAILKARHEEIVGVVKAIEENLKINANVEF